MATPTTSMHIPKLAQQGILEFHKSCQNMLTQNWNVREQMRAIDLAYMREQDWTAENTRAILANRYGDSNKLQNITVPVVMPQVEAAVAYQSSVFLTGLPIFESVASPAFEDEALQLNTIIEDQSVRGGWVRELQLFIRDGFKYNICALECKWDSIVTAALETDLEYSAVEAKPKSIVWEGNVIKSLCMYNTLYDTRCLPVDIPSKGEFAGYVELVSRIALKDFINKLPSKLIDNIIPAFESGLGQSAVGSSPQTFYIPQINPQALLNRDPRASTSWDAWAGISNPTPQIHYKNMYELRTLYGRIIPSDFGLRVPAPNTPQVWKFIFVNDILIYAERQTNAHNIIPILFGQPLEDGLGYQTKSLASVALPFQQASSTLLNQSFAASRKAIFDRMVYDPSRIREADINNPSPTSKIPVRPAAYGKSVGDAYQQIPFRDDQSAVVMQKIGQLAAFTDEATGRNRSQRGLFTKGNRTKEEYVDTMANASGRDQCISLLLEAQIFTPLKELIKINILQYQGGTTLYSATEQTPVDIDPVALRKAVLNFKMADGLAPINKQIDSATLQVAMQTIGASPQIAAGYNIGPMFSYLMKTQGAELKAFEKSAAQIAYEQAVGQWQQAMQMIAQAAEKGNVDPAILKQLPPQPTPDQFGYTPGALPQDSATQTKQQPTIMQQLTAATTQQTQGGTTSGAPNS